MFSFSFCYDNTNVILRINFYKFFIAFVETFLLNQADQIGAHEFICRKQLPCGAVIGLSSIKKGRTAPLRFSPVRKGSKQFVRQHNFNSISASPASSLVVSFQIPGRISIYPSPG